MTTAMLERPVVMDQGGAREQGDVQLLIEEKLENFDIAIEGHEFLEIDGDTEGNTPQEHFVKIINHKLESAFSISIDAVIRQDLDHVIEALETGTITRLYGVTRIVGYYSRTSNWNKSKIGELHDRHKGKYSV
ncbi:MAG: anaerobic ribonucleoside-triphosphate reductase [Candidatus Brocadiaceae bacterium]|nr:anaerobic ribonucleoside-triphosphate reductase [Candidatus Brocadiaceae bacterium]